MALFQKKPMAGSAAPLYSLGQQRTVLIAGLGNIGDKYDGTRHNIGFASIDRFTENQGFDPWLMKKDLKSQLTVQTLGNTRVVVIKPVTFMNNSGEALQATAHFYKVSPSNILVVHDELDIPFGQIRLRSGGTDAGNSGIKSIISHVGEGFGRVRIGIGSDTPMEKADFVLARFTTEESKHLDSLYKEVTSILTEYIYGTQLPADTRSFII